MSASAAALVTGTAESPPAKTRGTGRGWIVAATVAATVIDTTIEWYDFFMSGTAAAIVFNKIIFPTFDPVVGTMAAIATFAIGLIVRPFGGIIFQYKTAVRRFIPLLRPWVPAHRPSARV